jgi:hypothetical protein
VKVQSFEKLKDLNLNFSGKKFFILGEIFGHAQHDQHDR